MFVKTQQDIDIQIGSNSIESLEFQRFGSVTFPQRIQILKCNKMSK